MFTDLELHPHQTELHTSHQRNFEPAHLALHEAFPILELALLHNEDPGAGLGGTACLSQGSRHLKSLCQAHSFRHPRRQDISPEEMFHGNCFLRSLHLVSRMSHCSHKAQIRLSNNHLHHSHSLKHRRSPQCSVLRGPSMSFN